MPFDNGKENIHPLPERKILLTQLVHLSILLITLRCSSDLHTLTIIILLVLVSLSSSPKRLLLSLGEQLKTRWGEQGGDTETWAIHPNFVVLGEYG